MTEKLTTSTPNSQAARALAEIVSLCEYIINEAETAETEAMEARKAGAHTTASVRWGEAAALYRIAQRASAVRADLALAAALEHTATAEEK